MRNATKQTHSDNAAAVLAAIMRTFGYTDQWLADQLGATRASVQAKKTGKTRLSLDDIGELCTVFDVPVLVFYQPPAEAIRWIIDHPTRTLQMKYYGAFAGRAA